MAFRYSALQVCGRAPDAARIIPEVTEGDIAGAAQYAAHSSSHMAMIYLRLGERFLADGTAPALPGNQPVYDLGRNTVLRTDPATPP